MGIFDAFSGTKGRELAMQQEELARLAQRQANQRIAAGQGQITGLLEQGQGQQIGALDAGFTPSLDALSRGYDAATGALEQGRERYSPYAETGLRGFNAYADATGVNGQEGYDRAVGSFRAGPGYQYAVDQASDALSRSAAARGMGISGNTFAAIGDRARGMADQEYGAHLTRLAGLGQTGYNATGAQAGLDRDIGQLGVQRGTAEANLFDTDATRRADVYGNTTRLGANAISDATRASVDVLGNATNQVSNARQFGYQAGQQANMNSLGALFGIGNLLSGGAGSAMGKAGRSLIPEIPPFLLGGSPVGTFGR